MTYRPTTKKNRFVIFHGWFKRRPSSSFRAPIFRGVSAGLAGDLSPAAITMQRGPGDAGLAWEPLGGWKVGGGNCHPPVPTAGRPRYPLAVQMPPLHAVGASSKALKEVAALVEFSLATQFLARVTFYFCSELSSSSV